MRSRLAAIAGSCFTVWATLPMATEGVPRSIITSRATVGSRGTSPSFCAWVRRVSRISGSTSSYSSNMFHTPFP
jgi:hypothetical protein